MTRKATHTLHVKGIKRVITNLIYTDDLMFAGYYYNHFIFVSATSDKIDITCKSPTDKVVLDYTQPAIPPTEDRLPHPYMATIDDALKFCIKAIILSYNFPYPMHQRNGNKN